MDKWVSVHANELMIKSVLFLAVWKHNSKIPEDCSRTVVNQLIEDQQWSYLFKLLITKVLFEENEISDALKDMDLAKCVEDLITYQLSDVDIKTYVEEFLNHGALTNMPGSEMKKWAIEVAINKSMLATSLFLVEHGSPVRSASSICEDLPLVHKAATLAFSKGKCLTINITCLFM